MNGGVFGCWIIGGGSGLGSGSVALLISLVSIVFAALRRIERGLTTKDDGSLSLVCVCLSCCGGDTPRIG